MESTVQFFDKRGLYWNGSGIVYKQYKPLVNNNAREYDRVENRIRKMGGRGCKHNNNLMTGNIDAEEDIKATNIQICFRWALCKNNTNQYCKETVSILESFVFWGIKQVPQCNKFWIISHNSNC